MFGLDLKIGERLQMKRKGLAGLGITGFKCLRYDERIFIIWILW